jgi:hypothetical protein
VYVNKTGRNDQALGLDSLVGFLADLSYSGDFAVAQENIADSVHTGCGIDYAAAAD